MLFFSIKIPTTKREIMLYAVSLSLPSLLPLLHLCILIAWDKLDQCVIDMAVRQWRTRVQACVKAKVRTQTEPEPVV